MQLISGLKCWCIINKFISEYFDPTLLLFRDSNTMFGNVFAGNNVELLRKLLSKMISLRFEKWQIPTKPKNNDILSKGQNSSTFLTIKCHHWVGRKVNVGNIFLGKLSNYLVWYLVSSMLKIKQLPQNKIFSHSINDIDIQFHLLFFLEIIKNHSQTLRMNCTFHQFCTITLKLERI